MSTLYPRGGGAERSQALAAALKCDDEVYLANHGGRLVGVFGHAEDAKAYAAARLGGVEVVAAKVLDHAEARRLIEQEG